MAHYLGPFSLGLGDLIVSLPAVQGLIDSGFETHLVLRSPGQKGLAERIEGLAGAVPEEVFSRMSLGTGDVYLNMREHPLQKKYWWGSPSFDRDFPGWKINALLDIICKDLGINANFESLKPLKFGPREEVRDKVIFVPGSDGSYKFWTMENWLLLAEDFKSESVSVAILGQPDNCPAVRELLPFLPWLPTPTLADAIDLLSSAKAVVAVDTGLMHIAVHQGIPTIGLFRCHPLYWRDYPHNFLVTTRPCDASCLIESLRFSYPSVTSFVNFEFRSWTCQSPSEEACMAQIRHNSVFAVAQSNPELFLTQVRATSH
jgi:hypothetical protein